MSHKATTKIRNQRGVVKRTHLIFLLILGLILYVTYPIGIFYYGYYDLQGTMDALAPRAKELSQKELRRRLWMKVAENEIPIDKEDLIVQKTENDVYFSVRWQETLYFELFGFEYELWDYQFHASARDVW